MGEAVGLDHRADVVENNGLQHGRPHRAEHMDDQPAARGADEGRLLDAERRQPGKDVAGFDADIVMADIGIVGRLPAPAIVEGDDLARTVSPRRQMQRQLMKVAALRVRPGRQTTGQCPEFVSP